jgi:hypothetical protein
MTSAARYLSKSGGNRLRARPLLLLIGIAVSSGVLVIAGCGSSSKPRSAGESASSGPSAGVRYADCMRSHGVPNFPDPGGGAKPGFGVQLVTPPFQAAQKTCAGLLPGAGSGGSGPPSAALDKQMLAVAECMRAHGVSGFPDPTTTPPSSLAGNSFVFTQDGVSLVFPSTINLQSPAVNQAATARHFSVGPPGHGG